MYVSRMKRQPVSLFNAKTRFLPTEGFTETRGPHAEEFQNEMLFLWHFEIALLFCEIGLIIQDLWRKCLCFFHVNSDFDVY